MQDITVTVGFPSLLGTPVIGSFDQRPLCSGLRVPRATQESKQRASCASSGTKSARDFLGTPKPIDQCGFSRSREAGRADEILARATGQEVDYRAKTGRRLDPCDHAGDPIKRRVGSPARATSLDIVGQSQS